MSITTSGVAFIARFKLIPEKKQQFLDAHRSLMDKSGEFIAQAANFVFYGWGREENEWVAIEAWKSEDTLNTLRADPGFQEGVKSLLACVSAPVEISLYAGTSTPQSGFALYPSGVSAVHPPYGDMHVRFL